VLKKKIRWGDIPHSYGAHTTFFAMPKMKPRLWKKREHYKGVIMRKGREPGKNVSKLPEEIARMITEVTGAVVAIPRALK
jgi:hypothetical protein